MNAPKGRAARAWVPSRGTWRIVIARWLVFLLAAVPGVLAATSGLAGSIGRSPWFEGARSPLDVERTLVALREGSAAGAGALGVGLLVCWVVLQWLTAAAARALDPARSPAPDVRLELFEDGPRLFLRYLRVVAFAAVALLAGAWAIDAAFEAIGDAAARAGASLETRWIDLPLLQVLVNGSWASLVGVAGFWAKIVVAADDRRYIRRLPWTVLRLLARRPVSAVGFHLVCFGSVLVLQASALWSWRQSERTAVWIVLWLLLLFLAAFVWQVRVRAALLVWRGGGLDDLRAVPDAPWGAFRRLRRAPAAAAGADAEVSAAPAAPPG